MVSTIGETKFRV